MTHPVLWEVTGPGETTRHTTLSETAFEACAKRGLKLSECRVERTRALEPSMSPLRALVPVKHRWRALNGGIHAEHSNDNLSSSTCLGNSFTAE